MKKFISILKKIGKGLLIVLTIGFSLFVFLKIRKAILGKVKDKERTNFRKVPKDPHKIEITKKDGSTEIIQLPSGLKYKDVKKVGVSEGNKIIVEVLHEKVNRRNLSLVRDDNALDALRSRVRPTDKG